MTHEDVVREDQPSTPLGHLADAMLAVSNDVEGVKAIVMLYRESEGMVALGGYDEDGEAVADLFLYLQKLMAANGQELTILDAT